MTSFLTHTLVLLGAFFALVAAIGLLRMPDLLMRMHAATKAGTLGAGLLLLAVAVSFGDSSVTVRALAAIVFLFLTAPVAAHVIGRAAYYTGRMKLWSGTLVDELQEDRVLPDASSGSVRQGLLPQNSAPRPTLSETKHP